MTRFRYTPLHLACRNGHEAVAFELLHAGADFKVKDKEGKTPMRWAIDGHQILVGNKVETLDAQLRKEREEQEKETERLRLIQEEEERQKRLAAQIAQIKAEEEAARQQAEYLRRIASSAASTAAACAITAVLQAKLKFVPKICKPLYPPY
jgi:hypothetical protein